MPSNRSGGSVSDHTYQFRNGEPGSERADWNQGCWSLVWLTTRSSMTRMPRARASCSRSEKSPMLPNRGCTP
jgi:hypothetical protein